MTRAEPTLAAHAWRPLTEADAQALYELSCAIHKDLMEDIEVFKEKLQLFPKGCWKFCVDDDFAGYGLCHPWRLFSIPPLNTVLSELPRDADCLYIHDVAITAAARGRGALAHYVNIVRALAKQRGVSKLACVSVYGTHELWRARGFKIQPADSLKLKLASYGASAKYMIADA